jgi:hypothetical protein
MTRTKMNFILHMFTYTVGIATSYGLTMKWSEFESRWEQEFLFLHVVQIGSGSHLASYPLGTGGFSPWGKAEVVWLGALTSN